MKLEILKEERNNEERNRCEYVVNFTWKDDTPKHLCQTGSTKRFYYNDRKSYYKGSSFTFCSEVFFEVMNEEDELKYVKTIKSIDEIDVVKKTIYTQNRRHFTMYDNEEYIKEHLIVKPEKEYLEYPDYPEEDS